MLYDVAIIGCGPVGALLANLLGLRGHSVKVLERQENPYPLPRAIHFDGEAMRCFQATGLARQIEAHTHVGKGMLFKDRAGETLVDWSRDQVPGPMGWYESYRFYQPGLERVLRDGLDRFDQISMQQGRSVSNLVQTDDSVQLELENGDNVQARYVIGCDGAQSMTRHAIGAEMDDHGFQERWLVIDLLLTRPREDLGDYSIQYCDPENPGTYVRGVGNRRRWELRLRPGDPDVFPPELVWQRLARWITPEDAELERFAVYRFRSQIATSWRNHRCLISGDAAHQMPPFMGQGMCAGVRDAANLWWKLSAVLNGANPQLLDSYQTEREANARAFIEMSVNLGRLINQTAAGDVPKGRMKSIWPDLGPGFHDRAPHGGILAPQIQSADGTLADTAAQHQFYLIAREEVEAPIPSFVGAHDWLNERGLLGAVIRPDGYTLGGIKDKSDLPTVLKPIEGLLI